MSKWSVALFLLLAGGCSSELETGYEPRRLGDSTAIRRAYYAEPFSPELRAAQSEQAEEMKSRRPQGF